MKNSTVIIENEVLRKIKKGHIRDFKKEQGALDGRFKTQTVQSKKKYSKKDRRLNKTVIL
jgi:hypothetical protein